MWKGYAEKIEKSPLFLASVATYHSMIFPKRRMFFPGV
jgi:hypothetical protein